MFPSNTNATCRSAAATRQSEFRRRIVASANCTADSGADVKSSSMRTRPNQERQRNNRLVVRPHFLLACAAVFLILILPSVGWHKPLVQGLYVLIASLAILSAWYFLLTPRDGAGRARTMITLATSLYLTASIPIFVYQFSGIRWRLQHPLPDSLISMYVRPWVHWGFLLLALGLAASFFAQGRERIALLTASVFLLALRASMGTWIL